MAADQKRNHALGGFALFARNVMGLFFGLTLCGCHLGPGPEKFHGTPTVRVEGRLRTPQGSVSGMIVVQTIGFGGRNWVAGMRRFIEPLLYAEALTGSDQYLEEFVRRRDSAVSAEGTFQCDFPPGWFYGPLPPENYDLLAMTTLTIRTAQERDRAYVVEFPPSGPKTYVLNRSDWSIEASDAVNVEVAKEGDARVVRIVI